MKRKHRCGAALLSLTLVLQLLQGTALPVRQVYAAEQETEAVGDAAADELRLASGSEIWMDEDAAKGAEASDETAAMSSSEEIAGKAGSSRKAGAAAETKTASASEAERTADEAQVRTVVSNDAAAEEETIRGKALLFCIEHDASLKEDPIKDAEAMQAMLLRLSNFAEEDVHLIKIDTALADTTDLKLIIKDSIDEYLSDNDDATETMIYYSGHGSYDTQGGSSLALSKYSQDAVHARELRAWLEPYAGEINVVLDCCYSGGMLMTADLADEDDAPEADAFAEDFVKEFKRSSGQKTATSDIAKDDVATASEIAADDGIALTAITDANAADADSGDDEEGSSGQRGASKFRIVTAASRFETASQTDGIGGELTCAIGNALGYNRTYDSYNVCAADTDGDGEISMQELSAYVLKQPMVSQPVFYPEKDTTAMFRYDTDGDLAAADFDAALIGDATVNKEGRVCFTLQLTNRSDEARSFDVGVYDYVLDTQYYPIQQHFTEAAEKYDSMIYRSVDKEGKSEIELQGAETQKIPFELQLPDTDDNPYYYIRINGYAEDVNPWDTSGEVEDASFQLLTFTAHADSAMNPEAVQFRSPYMAEQASSALPVYRGSSLLGDYMPVILQFDDEPVRGNKKGTAACRLTIEVLDADGKLVSVLAKDRRPSYNNVESAKTTYKYSRYTCYWDYTYGADAENGQAGEKVPVMEEGDDAVCYQLRATVRYDDASLPEKTVTTWMELHAAADNVPRSITELTALSACTLEEAGTDKTLQNFQKTLQKSLTELQYAAGSDREMTMEILSWDCGADGVLSGTQAAKSSLAIVPGRTYTSTIRASLNAKDSSLIIPDCAVYFAGHPVKDVEVAKDLKSITFSVEHAIPKTESLDPSKVKLDPKESVKPGGKLKSAELQNVDFEEEDARYYVFYDGQVFELTEEGWEIPEDCTSFELWIVIGEGEEQSIYVVEYILEDEEPTPTPDPTPTPTPDEKTDGDSKTDPDGTTDGDNASDGKTDGKTDEDSKQNPDEKTDGATDGTVTPDHSSSDSGSTVASGTGSSHTGGGFRITAPTARKDGQWMQRGDGTWHYRADGVDLTGWQYLYYAGGPAWFLFDTAGCMQTGWQKQNGYWYYLEPVTGAMRTGWIEDRGQWYFLSPTDDGRPWGAMRTMTRTPDGYRLLADGRWDGQPKHTR